MFVGLFSGFSAQGQDMSEEQIKSRIQAVGKVHIAGIQAVSEASAGPRSGADIYAKSCSACHTPGIMGAPKSQVAADWTARLENGFDSVWKNAINGINAMPPRGTCGDCSDDDIKAAIEYMIEGV